MPTRPATFRLNQKEKTAHRPCEQWRGSAKQRGYDGDWVKLRNSFIADNPLCRHCNRRGISTLARYVDHVIPIRGADDERRLVSWNLQSLCSSCHAFKTKRQEDYRSFNPACRVVVVYGPPASGKTTYVSENRIQNDLVWDWDAEIAAVGGDRTDPEWAVKAVKVRQRGLWSAIERLPQDATAWVIQTWSDAALQIHGACGAEIEVIDTDAATCIERIKSDTSRGRVIEQQTRIVQVWHSEYEQTKRERRYVGR